MLQRMGPFMNIVLVFEYCSVISGILARRTRILKILLCFGQVHMHDVKHDLYNICLVFEDFLAFAALVVNSFYGKHSFNHQAKVAKPGKKPSKRRHRVVHRMGWMVRMLGCPS